MFLINLQGNDSIYEQIKSQIEKFINAGILKPDDKLPSVRSLAEELGINPNTVQKAYQELEKNGYIYTLNKKGAFVSRRVEDKENDLRRSVEYILKNLKDEGVEKGVLLDIMNDVYKEE